MRIDGIVALILTAGRATLDQGTPWSWYDDYEVDFVSGDVRDSASSL